MSVISDRVQTGANLATTLGLIIAILVFSCEVRNSTDEREYQSFLKMHQQYEKIVEKRAAQWSKVRAAVRENPKTANEIPDKQNSVDYLLLRMSQAEPMYAIEHGIIESELKSLNFLDKLCELALANDRAREILYLTDSHEISWYQNRLEDLLKLRESQKNIRLFTKPRYSSILKYDTSDYFGREP